MKYPRGKLRSDDKGKLAITFGLRGNTLVMDFGKPVGWIGLGLNDVRKLQEKLSQYEKTLAGFEL